MSTYSRVDKLCIKYIDLAQLEATSSNLIRSKNFSPKYVFGGKARHNYYLIARLCSKKAP